MFVNVVYRPPVGDLSQAETFFRKCFSENTKPNKILFLEADFYINVPDYENNKKVQIFFNPIFEFSMMHTINKPKEYCN